MAKVKVHVTVTDQAAGDPDARRETLARITEAAAVTDVNQSRFDRYGILTGMADDSALDTIRKVAGVVSVEIDSVKRLR
jgi:translation elongation factor EF-1beta